MASTVTSADVPDALASLRDSFALHLDSTRADKTMRMYLEGLDAPMRAHPPDEQGERVTAAAGTSRDARSATPTYPRDVLGGVAPPGFTGLALAVAIIGCGTGPPSPLLVGAEGPHLMDPRVVEAVVRRRVATNVAEVGRELRPLRVISIQLLQPGGEYAVEWPDGSGIMVVADPGERVWIVDAEGTFRDCREGKCATWDVGVIGIDDQTGTILFAWNRDAPHPWP